MDQGRLAGVGNLLADEMLWRAGLDPERRSARPGVTELSRVCTRRCGPPCASWAGGAGRTWAS